MIKLVVTDMDGTFLRPNLEISKANIEAVKKLLERNIHFAIATGRPDQMMKEYISILDLEEPIIMSNGSIIGNPFQEERVFEKTLSQLTLNTIFEIVDKQKMDYLIYTKEAIITRDNNRYRFFQKRNLSLLEKDRCNFIVAEIPSKALGEKKAYKILILENNEKRYKKYFELFSNRDDIEVYQSQTTFIDINPKGVSKGNAIKKLAEYYEIDVKDVVVFGDQHNDVPMMKIAGTSVAMGNSIDEVKRIADYVTLSNHEDGFAYWVNKYILGAE